MQINELLESINIEEGVNDPSIFKCVFVIGGPGSGKSKVTQLLALKALGFVSVNSDEAFTHLLKKRGLDLKMPQDEEQQRSLARARAKEITAIKMTHALDGRLGIVIDGTGEDYKKMHDIQVSLKELGYEFYLVVVYADLQTALGRNAKRERSVPEHIVKTKWYGVQKNMDNFLTLFSHNIIIDNNGNLTHLVPQTDYAHKIISKWASTEPKSETAISWIQQNHGGVDIDYDENDDIEDDDIEDEVDDEEEDIPEPEEIKTDDEKIKEGFYKDKVITHQEKMNKETGHWPTVDSAVKELTPKFWNVEINGRLWKKWNEPVKIANDKIDRVINSIRGPRDVVKKILSKS
jgi:dephospho-CoA kinase